MPCFMKLQRKWRRGNKRWNLSSKIMLLLKLKNGHYAPVYPADIDESGKIPIGEEVRATRARNPAFHRKAMALIRMLFENQDTETREEVHRKITIINCGFYDEAANKEGVVVPIPRSLSFGAMSETEFQKFYSALLDVAVIKLQSSPEEIQAELINFM